MFSLPSPTEYMEKLKRLYTPQMRLAFISAFATGFFCHLFIFTNSMYNNDDIRYLHVTFDKPELGRWLQTYAAGVSSYFSLPVVNGILGLIWLSLTASILVKMFDMHNSLLIMLISGIIVTFPSVAAIYSYMFAADPFFLACLLSVLAAYFATRTDRPFGFIPAALFLCMSTGIYQAYLSFTLLLLLLYFLLILVQPQRYTDRQIVRIIPRYLITLALGMGAYYLLMQLTLRVKHITLSDYQGIGSSGISGITDMKNRLGRILSDFLDFFRPGQVLAFNLWVRIFTVLCLLLLFLFFFILYQRGQVYKNWLRNILILLCALCIPLCADVIYLISDDVIYHMLMRHSWCLLFAAVLIFYEKAEPCLGKGLEKPAQWLAVISVFIILWNYILLDNISYFNMNFRYEKTYALCLKIVDRLEQTPDYDRHRPMAFIGRYSKVYKDEYLDTLLEPVTGTKGSLIPATSRAYLPFMQNCLGEDISIVSEEEENAIKATEEFESMPRFPGDGSIRVINDVTVIKLND